MTLTADQFAALTREFDKLDRRLAALEASIARLLAPSDPYGQRRAPYFQDGNRQ